MAPIPLDASPPTERASRRDVAALFERYHADRDPGDREALVQRFLPLARHLSRKYFAAAEREDLEQVASIGLLKAIDRYDPSRGIAFTSFAVPTILGELKRYFRDLGWTVRVPRSLQELGPRVEQAGEALLRELGRPPTIAEIADRCDITPEQVLETRNLGSAHRAISLDVPVADDESMTRADALGAEEDGFRQVETAYDVDRLLATLPMRERMVVHLRFREDLTQREIAARLGLSQMHVSRLLRNALAQLDRT